MRCAPGAGTPGRCRRPRAERPRFGALLDEHGQPGGPQERHRGEVPPSPGGRCSRGDRRTAPGSQTSRGTSRSAGPTAPSVRGSGGADVRTSVPLVSMRRQAGAVSLHNRMSTARRRPSQRGPMWAEAIAAARSALHCALAGRRVPSTGRPTTDRRRGCGRGCAGVGSLSVHVRPVPSPSTARAMITAAISIGQSTPTTVAVASSAGRRISHGSTSSAAAARDLSDEGTQDPPGSRPWSAVRHRGPGCSDQIAKLPHAAGSLGDAQVNLPSPTRSALCARMRVGAGAAPPGR